MITGLIIAAMASTMAPQAQTSPTPMEVLEAQIGLCASVTERKDGLAILDNEMIRQDINEQMRLETLKICVAFNVGRVYQAERSKLRA